MFRPHHTLIAPSLLVLAVLMPTGASAASLVVTSGQTETATVDLDAGDTLLVEEGGKILTTNTPAIKGIAANSEVGIVNYGVIYSDTTPIQTGSTNLTLSNFGSIGSLDNGVAGKIINSLFNGKGAIIDAGVGDGVLAQQIEHLENAGTIEASVDGVRASNTLLTLINSGNIKAGMIGVSVRNDAGAITNTGSIDGARGIQVEEGDLQVLNNSGSISGTAYGVEIEKGLLGETNNSGHILAKAGIKADTIGTLTNSGTIGGTEDAAVEAKSIGTLINSNTIAGTSYGVVATAGDIGLLDNSGTITGLKAGVSAQNAAIVNSGHIGGILAGVETSGGLSLHNAGTIGANTGPAISAGIISDLSNSGEIKGNNALLAQRIQSLTNSGLIAGETPAFFAIDEDTGTGIDTILSLRAGSIIVGRVDISAGNDTLKVGDGLNLALTFDTSVPELIETGSNPYLVAGNTVYVVDVNAVTAATDIASALSNGIGGLVGTALQTGFEEKGANGEGNYWLEGFAVAAQRHGGRQLAGGLAGGVDFGPDADTRVGVLGGVGKGLVTGSDVESVYAGIYGAAQFDDFSAEGVLLAGTARVDHARVIANNTIVGGLETATGLEDAIFVAPQLTLRKSFVAADMLWDASVTLGYTGVFSGGYAETGVAAPLTVEPSTSHNFSAKALVSLPFAVTDGPGVLTGDLRGGAVADVSIGGTKGTLGGMPLVFDAGRPALSAGLTGGMAIDYEFPGGATLFGALDGTIYHDLSYAVTGQLGLKGSF